MLGEYAEHRHYLESSDLLPVLEAGIEAMLETGTNKTPALWLGEWLKAHNPKHNYAMAAKIAAVKEGGRQDTSGHAEEAIPSDIRTKVLSGNILSPAELQQLSESTQTTDNAPEDGSGGHRLADVTTLRSRVARGEMLTAAELQLLRASSMMQIVEE